MTDGKILKSYLDRISLLSSTSPNFRSKLLFLGRYNFYCLKFLHSSNSSYRCFSVVPMNQNFSSTLIVLIKVVSSLEIIILGPPKLVACSQPLAINGFSGGSERKSKLKFAKNIPPIYQLGIYPAERK